MYDLKRGFYDVMSTLYISIPGPLNFQILQKSAVDYIESLTFITECIYTECNVNTRAVRRLSARGITTDPGSNPGCIITGPDWESHRTEHN